MIILNHILYVTLYHSSYGWVVLPLSNQLELHQTVWENEELPLLGHRRPISTESSPWQVNVPRLLRRSSHSLVASVLVQSAAHLEVTVENIKSRIRGRLRAVLPGVSLWQEGSDEGGGGWAGPPLCEKGSGVTEQRTHVCSARLLSWVNPTVACSSPQEALQSVNDEKWGRRGGLVKTGNLLQQLLQGPRVGKCDFLQNEDKKTNNYVVYSNRALQPLQTKEPFYAVVH